MRRRIDTSESFSDCSASPHHYLDVFDGELHLREPPPVLHGNEGLWRDLQDAYARVRSLERQVREACVDGEPLDAFEVECGIKLWKMLCPPEMGGVPHDQAAWDRITAALREHQRK